MSEHEQLQQVSAPLQFLKTSHKIEQDALSDLVDLYCFTDQLIAPERATLKIKEKELSDIEKEIQESLDSGNLASADGVHKTDAWLLQFGAKGKVTEVVDKKKIREILGDEVFMEIISVSITEIKKYLTAKQLEEVTVEINKNKRKLSYAKAKT